MTDHLVLHKPTDDATSGFRTETIPNAHTCEEAVRLALNDLQIAEREYVVYEVARSFHRDQFEHDGVFDGIHEKFE